MTETDKHDHADRPNAPANQPADRNKLDADRAMDPGLKALAEALRWLFAVLKVVMVIVIGLFIWSGVYKVEQNEQAVVLRFGRVKGIGARAIRQPGLHWAWPYPIEEVIRIPAANVVRRLNINSFWYYMDEKEKAGIRKTRPGPQLQFVRDGYSLTASKSAAEVRGSAHQPEPSQLANRRIRAPITDYNLVHTRWSIRYQVSDPLAFVENLWDGTPGRAEKGNGWYAVETFLQSVLCDSVIITSAHRDINMIIWEDPQRFRSEVEHRLIDKLQHLQVGLTASLEYLEHIPPRQVKQYFDAAAGANIEKNKKITEAQAQADEIRSQAQAQATEIISQARAYREQLVQSAKADAEYLREVLGKINAKVRAQVPEGSQAASQRHRVYKELLAQTVDQLYHEMLREVMAGVEETMVLNVSEGSHLEWRPWLSRDAQLGRRGAKTGSAEQKK